MNGKTAVTGVLVGAIVLFAVLEYDPAAAQTTGAPVRIGVVSVRNVFNGSKRQVQYQAMLMKQQSQARARMENLTKEIETEEAELKTLKEGTADYMQQLQGVLDKRARLEGQKEYLKQQRLLENKKWTEDLYQDVLRMTKEIAKEKGLDLVLERTEPEFPVSSDELMAALGTHKVLYDGGCVDLTNEVIARIDAAEGPRPQNNQ
jgi:Skp family chaperone for outer membrane proteins